MEEQIDSTSGCCPSNSVFYSKRKPLPLPLPPNNALDVTIAEPPPSSTPPQAASSPTASYGNRWRARRALSETWGFEKATWSWSSLPTLLTSRWCAWQSCPWVPSSPPPTLSTLRGKSRSRSPTSSPSSPQPPLSCSPQTHSGSTLSANDSHGHLRSSVPSRRQNCSHAQRHGQDGTRHNNTVQSD